MKNDVIELHRRHVQASVKRDEYARRAIALLAEGKDEAGLDAAEQAEVWALRALMIEQHCQP
jgi:hypothetical protein